MQTLSAIIDQLRVPVVAAPMFLISGPELVIATSRAGGIGAFPAPNCRTSDELDMWMTTIARELNTAPKGTYHPVNSTEPQHNNSPQAAITDLPWAVNLVTHRSNNRLADDVKMVAKHRPPIVITALGSPKPVIDTVHAYGGSVIADVIDLKLARKAVQAGADGLACIAAGAGGHTGFMSPFAFISGVREFFTGPVIVGGGIADGHGVAGAIVAGADLVYMGTRFLATHESLAPDAYKQMVVDSTPEDLIVSDGVTGTPASWLRPSLLANGLDPDALAKPDARHYDTGAAHRWKDIWAAGQGLDSIRTIDSAERVIDRLARDFESAATRLAATARGRTEAVAPAR